MKTSPREGAALAPPTPSGRHARRAALSNRTHVTDLPASCCAFDTPSVDISGGSDGDTLDQIAGLSNVHHGAHLPAPTPAPLNPGSQQYGVIKCFPWATFNAREGGR